MGKKVHEQGISSRAGYKLELASGAQVSSISVRHHTSRHLMFSIFPRHSSPPSIPPLLLSLVLASSEVGHRMVPLDLGSSACWVERREGVHTDVTSSFSESFDCTVHDVTACRQLPL